MADAEILVGTGAGTVYRVPTYDDDTVKINFDPSTAPTQQIVFKMPAVGGGFNLLTRTAVAAQVTIDGASVWALTYTVTAADLGAYSSASVGGFHVAAGKISMEGYVFFSSAQEWASSTVTRDQQDRILQVKARLSA